MFLSILGLLVTCLIATVIIETALAAVLGVRKKDLAIVVLAQIVTNPIVVLVSNLTMYLSPRQFRQDAFLVSLAVMEIFAIIAEGLMYKYFFKDYKKNSPFVLSVSLNVISVIIGLLVGLIQAGLE